MVSNYRYVHLNEHNMTIPFGELTKEALMQYRTLPHGGEKIGVIGMGSAVVGQQKEKDIIETVRTAVELGVNYFDLAAGHAACFPAYGKALAECRKNVYLQIHFGANYTTGEYGWTTDLEAIKRSIGWQLDNLKTDYIDHPLSGRADGRGGIRKERCAAICVGHEGPGRSAAHRPVLP